MLIFIEGGAKSGKTSLAEKVIQERTDGRPVYIATAAPQDTEMEKRIRDHRLVRNNARVPWVTIEQPFDLKNSLEQINTGDHVLLDCLTTWLSNEMFTSESWNRREGPARMLEAIIALEKKSATLIIVSSDISHQPAVYPDMIHFLKIQGWLSCRIVEKADLAGIVNYGILRLMKGEW